MNRNTEQYRNHHFNIPKNDFPKIVVIGAGFAGINFIKQLKDAPVQIILIDQNNFHQFQPLLYQVAISGLEPDAVVSPIRKLFRSYKNLVYRMAEVEDINIEQKRVNTNIGFVNYDHLIIATGSSTNFYGSTSIEKNSIGLKSIQDAINVRSWMLQNLEKAVDGGADSDHDSVTNFVVVGGGPAGVEMAGAMAEFKKYLLANDYPEINPKAMKIFLIQADDRILPAMSQRASKHALSTLTQLGVKCILNTRVNDYDGSVVTLTSPQGEEKIEANTLVWTAGVKGNVVAGIPEDAVVPGNRISVNEYNLVLGLNSVYAIGDVASMASKENPRGHPMVAQVAIQQGKNLAKNLSTFIQSEKFTTPFSYVDKGSMATIGKKDAVADLKIGFLNGRIGWVLWSFIHLISITGFQNRLQVAFSWMLKYFSYEKANQLIIRRYKRE